MEERKMCAKKCLLICPRSYDYYVSIINELETKGFVVSCFHDFDENLLSRSVRFISKSMSSFFQNIKYKNIIDSIKKQSFDVVLIIRGYQMRESIISNLRNNLPNAQFILYQWDPLSISRFEVRGMRFFDKCFTFDFKDSTLYKELSLLPLFYIPDNNSMDSVNNFKYDISFVGALHGKRLYVITKLLEGIKPNDDIKHFFRLTMNRFKYVIYYIISPLFRSVPSIILPNVINKSDTQLIYSQSRAVLDIHHPLQTGLSIRVLEVLSKKRKLITTNSIIKMFSFYDPSYVYILDTENIDIDSLKHFLYLPIDYRRYEEVLKYRIDNWVDKLLN